MFEGLDQSFLKNNDSWVQSYKSVIWTDIGSIDNLVVKTEAVVQKYGTPNEDLRRSIYSVFEELLERYPLFFGYWKRYVAVRYQLEGIDASITTLERALSAFPTSIDLWIDMLNVNLTHNQDDIELVRRQFAKCEALVGHHFLSHDVWDKHIAFETNLHEWGKVYDVYKRILKIPLHQYARFYSSLKELLENQPELADLDPNFDADKIFIANQDIVNKLWVYESKIKQSFFNLPEVADEELKNWDAYLGYLINEPNMSKEVISCTFERCLIPCFRYEHFWTAYISWTDGNFGIAKTLPLYDRATKALPPENKSFKLTYIQYLEKNVDTNDKLLSKYYMDALYSCHMKCPQDPSMIIKFLAFHKKVHFPCPLEEGEQEIITQQEKYASFLDATIKAYLSKTTVSSSRNVSQQLLAMLDDKTLPVVIVELIKLHWLVLKHPVQCRKYFTHFSKLDLLKSSAPYWTTYYKFEKTQKNVAKLLKFVDQLGSEIMLPTRVINDLLTDFQRFYLTNTSRSEYEQNLNHSRFGFDPLLHTRYKINNPSWKPHQKLSKNWFRSDEFKSNGHPGLIIDKPQIRNSIIESLASRRSQQPPELPAFRNLEKIHQRPKYEDYMSIEYLQH